MNFERMRKVLVFSLPFSWWRSDRDGEMLPMFERGERRKDICNEEVERRLKITSFLVVLSFWLGIGWRDIWIVKWSFCYLSAITHSKSVEFCLLSLFAFLTIVDSCDTCYSKVLPSKHRFQWIVTIWICSFWLLLEVNLSAVSQIVAKC